jgi:L-ascorbate metabolism protein UlaG (beta-lactamase superfamily)
MAHPAQPSMNKSNMEQKHDTEKILAFAKSIRWLGQATVRISFNGLVIYIDPYQIKTKDTADLVLITHDHGDHLSLVDIGMVAGNNTRFIVAGACRDKLIQAGYKNTEVMAPGMKTTLSGIGIAAVPAYNMVKDMHPKDKNYVGYILDFNGICVYHTGDTERIPEMKEIRCDIILLPLGQTYTMNSVEEAAAAVLDTRAIVAIPIHWGMYEGSAEDARKFGKLMQEKGIAVLPGK